MTTPCYRRALAIMVLVMSIGGGAAATTWYVDDGGGAAATTWYVDDGGGAAATTWYVDDGGGAGIDFTKIQDAVDAASDGDMIIVYNGTYYENVNINNQLTLEGVGMPVVNAGWSGSAIAVGADGCTVDGFYVTGGTAGRIGGWYGIAVESNNNLIKNNIASEISDGIYLSDSFNNTITGNSISNNNHGIRLQYSNHNTISYNIVFSNFNEGINLLGSNNNALTGNTVSNNTEGISIGYHNSDNNKLRNNILQDNIYNIHVGGWSLPDYHQDIDTSNTVNGKPIYYWVEEKDKTIDISTDAGYVALISCNNIVVKDLDITNNGEGILLVNTITSTLQDNTISNCRTGIALTYSSNNNDIEDNTISNCGTGISLTYSSNNNDIEDNTLSNNHNGIHILASTNTLTGNDLLDNSYRSINVFGSTKDDYDNAIDTSNSINGKPVYYYFDQDDTVIEGLDTCHLTLAFCSNITLKSNTVNDGDGIALRFSDNSSISECTISSNEVGGIRLYDSDDTTIAYNTIQDNSHHGIFFMVASNNNTVTGNDVSNNDYGIEIVFSSNNTLSSNTLNSNGDGISLYSSNDNILSDNEVSDNDDPDYIESTGIDLEYSANNTISRNNVSNSDVGIKLEDSSSNSIYHNNLMGNINHACDDDGTNSWGNGYPSGGNYWSDYVEKYPDAEEIDESGIWDTPYDISGGAGAKDDYPLMEPWTGDTSQKGDLNSDNILTPADAAIALAIATSGAHDPAADVSGDDRVTSLDALMILQAAAGAIEL